MIFLEKSSQLGVFWPTRGLQINHGTVRKREITLLPGNQKPTIISVFFETPLGREHSGKVSTRKEDQNKPLISEESPSLMGSGFTREITS